MNSKALNKKGQSLIEIIIALALFIGIVASLSSLIIGSYAGLSRAADINEAEGLAEEALAAIESVRNRAWNELIYSRSAIEINNNQWELSGEGTSEQVGKFSRVIDFTSVYRDVNNDLSSLGEPGAWLDPMSRIVNVTLSWQTTNNQSVNLSKTTMFSNWQALNWTQDDWSSGFGQDIWSSIDRYKSDDGNLEISNPGEISLLSLSTTTYATSAYLISSAYPLGEAATFSAISWDEQIPGGCPSCLIKLRIKTAPDSGGNPGTWSSTWCGPEGEDGDESDYFFTNTGELIDIDHNSDEWIQYRVDIEGDGSETPRLEKIYIYYN